MDPTDRFAALFGDPDGAVPLDEAALLIAAHARPALDVATEQSRLDDLAAGVGAPTLDGLRAHLFGELGFSGNRTDYYDERNSYLDQVVQRRTGIPITLSVLVIEVGRRVGVPLVGVSMPGHFLVRDAVDTDVFVDPFAGGAIVDRPGAERRFRESQGPGSAFHRAFLEPVPAVTIAARMLANLDAIATARSDRAMLEWVLRLRTSLPGAPASLHHRFSSALAACGRFSDAAVVLERLATSDIGSRPDDLAAAGRLRAKLN